MNKKNKEFKLESGKTYPYLSREHYHVLKRAFMYLHSRSFLLKKYNLNPWVKLKDQISFMGSKCIDSDKGFLLISKVGSDGVFSLLNKSELDKFYNNARGEMSNEEYKNNNISQALWGLELFVSIALMYDDNTYDKSMFRSIRSQLNVEYN